MFVLEEPIFCEVAKNAPTPRKRASNMEIKTGVDPLWIADSRASLVELIRIDKLTPIGEEETPESLAATAAAYADAMAAERAKRGGARDPSDPRAMIALVQEVMPAVIAFFENLDKMAAKRRATQRRERDEGRDGE